MLMSHPTPCPQQVYEEEITWHDPATTLPHIYRPSASFTFLNPQPPIQQQEKQQKQHKQIKPLYTKPQKENHAYSQNIISQNHANAREDTLLNITECGTYSRNNEDAKNGMKIGQAVPQTEVTMTERSIQSIQATFTLIPPLSRPTHPPLQRPALDQHTHQAILKSPHYRPSTAASNHPQSIPPHQNRPQFNSIRPILPRQAINQAGPTLTTQSIVAQSNALRPTSQLNGPHRPPTILHTPAHPRASDMFMSSSIVPSATMKAGNHLTNGPAQQYYSIPLRPHFTAHRSERPISQSSVSTASNYSSNQSLEGNKPFIPVPSTLRNMNDYHGEGISDQSGLRPNQHAPNSYMPSSRSQKNGHNQHVPAQPYQPITTGDPLGRPAPSSANNNYRVSSPGYTNSSMQYQQRQQVGYTKQSSFSHQDLPYERRKFPAPGNRMSSISAITPPVENEFTEFDDMDFDQIEQCVSQVERSQ